MDEGIRAEVDALFPRGNTYVLPEEWASGLAALPERKESPTSITTFLSCPLKWYLDRYSSLEGGDTSAFGVIGTFVHRVLEVFYTEYPDRRSEDMLWDVYDAAVDDIQDLTSDTGIIPEELKVSYQEVLVSSDKGPDYSRNWFFRRAKESVGNILAFDERPDMLPVTDTETWVRTRSNGVLVRGKIDRITSTIRGERIDDYKTGRAPSDREAAAIDAQQKTLIFQPKFVPMGLYALMRSEFDNDGIPQNPVASVRLLYLSDVKMYTSRMTPERMEGVAYLLDRVTSEMNDTVFSHEIVANPGDDEQNCTYCPARGVCPFFTGDFSKMRSELGI